MKLRILALLLSFPLVMWGCEDSGEASGDAAAGEEGAAAEGGEAAADAGAEGGEEAKEAGEAAAEGPAAVCAKVIEAIKAKDVAAVVALCTEGAGEAITADSIGGMATALGEANCGEATIDGDKATVAATAGEEKRDIPFAKAGDAWKFDAAAYAKAYPAAKAEEAKAEGKGKAKAKGKKKKKKKKK